MVSCIAAVVIRLAFLTFRVHLCETCTKLFIYLSKRVYTKVMFKGYCSGVFAAVD